MRPVIVIGINGLSVTEHLGKGDEITDGTRITNDFSAVACHLPPVVAELIGSIELHHLRTRQAVVYWIGETNQQFDHPLQDLGRQLALVQGLLMELWMLIDNSVNSDTGMFFHAGGKEIFGHTNHRVVRFCLADGGEAPLAVDREQLRAARTFAREMWERSNMDERRTALGRDTSRYSRASYFIQASRSTGDLGLKIANYVQALEAIFCSGSGEISHSLGERCAFYLHSDSPTRIQTYDLVKAAYSIRSRVVHGDSLSSERIRTLDSISIGLDRLARQVMVKLGAPGEYEDFELRGEHFENAMVNRILRGY